MDDEDRDDAPAYGVVVKWQAPELRLVAKDFRRPAGLAVASDGAVLVTARAYRGGPRPVRGSVFRIDPSGAVTLRYDERLRRADGLASDALDRIFLAGTPNGGGRGGVIRLVAEVPGPENFATQLERPRGLALEQSGNLLVADAAAGVLLRFKAPNPPVVDSRNTENGVLRLTGTVGIGSRVVVVGGRTVVSAPATAAGRFSVDVPLSEGSSRLLVYAVGSGGRGLASHPTEIVLAQDTIPPEISANVDPAPNAAGWHRTDVTVTFTCRDAGSGIATCPPPVTVTTEGREQVILGTAVDRAGNSATASVTLNIEQDRAVDRRAAGARTQRGGLEQHRRLRQVRVRRLSRWNRRVRVTAHGRRRRSSPAGARRGPRRGRQHARGCGQHQSRQDRTAADRRGVACAQCERLEQNRGHRRVPLLGRGLRCGELPHERGRLVRRRGAGGLAFSERSRGQHDHCERHAQDRQDATRHRRYRVSVGQRQRLEQHRRDRNVHVRRRRAGGMSNAGHHRLRGCAQLVSRTVEDQAGNTATASATASIDKTPPTLAPSLSPPANAAGWNRTDVEVSFIPHDALSGIAISSPPATVTTEGQGQLVSGSAVDRAGNPASAAAQVSVDKTAPTVTIASPSAGTVRRVPTVEVSGDVVENFHIASITIDGVTQSPVTPFLADLVLTEGPRTVTVAARDVADNIGSASVDIVDSAPWAELMWRTFAIDALVCPTCQGRMKLLAVVRNPARIARYLKAAGEPTDAPSRSPNRGPPYWKSRILRRQALGDKADGRSHDRNGDEVA